MLSAVGLYFSFQACERVRHLGCLSAQAIASRYDNPLSFSLYLVTTFMRYMRRLKDRARMMAMLRRLGP